MSEFKANASCNAEGIQLWASKRTESSRVDGTKVLRMTWEQVVDLVWERGQSVRLDIMPTAEHLIKTDHPGRGSELDRLRADNAELKSQLALVPFEFEPEYDADGEPLEEGRS